MFLPYLFALVVLPLYLLVTAVPPYLSRSQAPGNALLTSPPLAKGPKNVIIEAHHRSLSSWVAPQTFTTLAPFHITKFADGQNNLQLVNDAGTTLLQISYPKDSINPGNSGHPMGGVDFYASPLDISKAQTVTFEYSVYFPANFDWVKGGKLPGLYGGKVGCSGGDAALNCFSTRLMWRAKGAGELYLYAPKSLQGPGVCATPPFSDCDPAYGLSIGRGSFHFMPGAWTTVKQTVQLNTPGVANGRFILEANGELAMDVRGVYYRKAAATSNTAVVGLIGIFFSTFFGGHDTSFMTPIAQKTLYKGFALSINA